MPGPDIDPGSDTRLKLIGMPAEADVGHSGYGFPFFV